MKSMLVIFLLAVTLALGMRGTAQSTPMTIHFSGIIDEIIGRPAAQLGALATGDQFTGSLTYNISGDINNHNHDYEPDPHSGKYQDANCRTFFTMNVVLGRVTVSEGGVGWIDVLNDTNPSYSFPTVFGDSIYFDGGDHIRTNFPDLGGSWLGLSLWDSSGNVFSDDSLPETLYPYDFDGGTFGVEGLGFSRILGTINTIAYGNIAPVPEPSTILLVAAGLISVAVIRRNVTLDNS